MNTRNFFYLLSEKEKKHLDLQGIRKDKDIDFIYRYLNKVLIRFPNRFEFDLLNEYHCLFALSLPAFRQIRLEKHLYRMILSQYLTRKEVKQSLLFDPEKRHLVLRFLPTTLKTPFGKKRVIGIMVTLSFFDHFERFDDEHLLSAVQKWVPDARIVAASRYFYQHPEEKRMLTLYIELDKEQGFFSLQERKMLRRKFLQEIKDRVQKLLPTVYNLRNEENIMKNMIILGQELRDSSCLPQLMISFEKQTEIFLIFTVILVYVAHEKIKEDAFLQLDDASIEIFFERKERVGYLSSRIPKEAIVLRAKVRKMPDIQRQDFSIDAYTARRKVYSAVSCVMGEVRDYDGGLIQKQQELFSQFQQRFFKYSQEYNDLLELFFYGIAPVEKQATLSIIVIEQLFLLVLNSLNSDFSKKGAHFIQFFEYEGCLYAFVRTDGQSFKKHVHSHLENSFDSNQFLTTSTFLFRETSCLAFFLGARDPHKHRQLKEALLIALEIWKKEQEEVKFLRLHFVDNPFSLDPRMAGDESTQVILQLLFEGLMRLSEKGEPECSLAESVEISQDQKNYVFRLRKSFWSNQKPLVASDFAYAWKKILSPAFSTPFSQVFYCIKNARLVKEGLLPSDSLGIYVLDSHTLSISLEYPVPYFLEMLTRPLFAPVNEQIDVQSPQWTAADGIAYVCNGPFFLLKNQGDKGYILEKNPWYWDTKNVTLNRIVFSKSNIRTALEMFKLNKLDWFDRPLRLGSPLLSLVKTENSEIIYLKEKIISCMLNTKCFPLNSKKIRQALALCLDRQEFIENSLGAPAYSLLQSDHTFYPQYGSPKGDIEFAQQIFQKALAESELSLSSFPSIVLSHSDTEMWKKVASTLKKQWEQNLGIDVICLCEPWPQLLGKVAKGEYTAVLMHWFSWVNNPLYTLNVFKFADGGVNFPQWQNLEFQSLLNRAIEEKNMSQRDAYIAHAEAILIKECPAIPILYEKEIALKRKHLQVPIHRGHVYFKKALLNT